MKNNAYKKNTMGKWVSDIYNKKIRVKVANRRVRRSGKNVKEGADNA